LHIQCPDFFLSYHNGENYETSRKYLARIEDALGIKECLDPLYPLQAPTQAPSRHRDQMFIAPTAKGVKPKPIKKREKEKSFATEMDRNTIMECKKLDIEIDEFSRVCLEAKQEIAVELGL
jgi:hypothetical protein